MICFEPKSILHRNPFLKLVYACYSSKGSFRLSETVFSAIVLLEFSWLSIALCFV